MGVREEGVQNVTESQKSMSHAMSNDEIDDPEWIDIMIELTKAAERAFILKNRNEFSTFTLIPEYDQTPEENENFNRKKDMEKEKLPEKKMANKAAREEKEKVLEKEVELSLNDEFEKIFFRNYLGDGVNPSMERIVKMSKTRHMTLP
ncbi:uncharacterized protein LOC121805439 [Salvia splendens]|uniref:uncharacterized protein LOC121805439 n=1 Tax=Salvia splendens TaxID=180675 RepID=UPI001C267B53|nr:uncharacterized protein LOC121805439 [Salvia splendens]